MLKINSYVIYGANGVCKVVDKRTERQYGKKQTYYVLQPTDKKDAYIFVPENNTELINKMKNLLSKDEIISIITKSRTNEIPWIDNSRERTEYFNSVLTEGNREKILLLIRTLYKKRKELNNINKKLRINDETVMKMAENVINTEFSIVLDIPPEDVPAFIGKTMETA